MQKRMEEQASELISKWISKIQKKPPTWLVGKGDSTFLT